MSLINALHCAYLSYFSTPRGERVLYRTIRKRGVRSIVEIGIDSLVCTRRLIDMAKRCRPSAPIRYTGIDLFEGREQPRAELSLKQVHRQLAPLNIKVRLVPGDPLTALARAANTLSGTDLLILRVRGEEMAAAWMYVPRMLHERSQVFVLDSAAEGGRGGYHILAPAAVVARSSARRAA